MSGESGKHTALKAHQNVHGIQYQPRVPMTTRCRSATVYSLPSPSYRDRDGQWCRNDRFVNSRELQSRFALNRLQRQIHLQFLIALFRLLSAQPEYHASEPANRDTPNHHIQRISRFDEGLAQLLWTSRSARALSALA